MKHLDWLSDQVSDWLNLITRLFLLVVGVWLLLAAGELVREPSHSTILVALSLCCMGACDNLAIRYRNRKS